MATIDIPADFTLDELLAYLRSEAEDRDGFHTAREWAERFEVSIKRMRAILREAKEAGKLLRDVSKRERLDGQMQLVPVYRFILDEGESEMTKGADSGDV